MDPLWTPKNPEKSAVAAFIQDVNKEFKTQFSNYHELWRWSVEHKEEFWSYWWNYVGPLASKQPKIVLANRGSF